MSSRWQVFLTTVLAPPPENKLNYFLVTLQWRIFYPAPKVQTLVSTALKLPNFYCTGYILNPHFSIIFSTCSFLSLFVPLSYRQPTALIQIFHFSWDYIEFLKRWKYSLEQICERNLSALWFSLQLLHVTGTVLIEWSLHTHEHW
jgi:hypothetical protein